MDDPFVFTCPALGDELRVLAFRAVEEISALYQVEIVLQCDTMPDDETALGQRATLSVRRDEGEPVPFHGVVASVELLGQVGERFVYRAMLVPKLWHLTHSLHSRIFVDESLPGICRRSCTTPR